MLILPEERSSRGPLIAFIDLLFLLVAFVTLLLFFVQQRHQLSEQQLAEVQQRLSRVAGEQVDLPQALATLERMVDRFEATQAAQVAQERAAAARRERRAKRHTVRLEYTLSGTGQIVYEGRGYDTASFLKQVVNPLRKKSWVAFRAYAAPQTPFGAVVEQRRLLLQDSNEFDTYWDNVTRQEGPAPSKADPAAGKASP